MQRTTLEQGTTFTRITTRMTSEELYMYYSSQVPQVNVYNSMDIGQDIQWDMLIIMMDALIANKLVTLTPEQQTAYAKLKYRWPLQKATDLQSNTYELDWCFDVEDLASNLRRQYYAKKAEFGYPF